MKTIRSYLKFMWIKRIFSSVLNYFGFYKPAKILLLGLDNAGKTTLLNLLKKDRIIDPSPTQHPTSEELMIDGITFQVRDLGGHEVARKVWRDYQYTKVDAVVYLVDSNDSQARINESKEQLHSLARNLTSTIPFLVLGNKMDIMHARNAVIPLGKKQTNRACDFE